MIERCCSIGADAHCKHRSAQGRSSRAADRSVINTSPEDFAKQQGEAPPPSKPENRPLRSAAHSPGEPPALEAPSPHPANAKQARETASPEGPANLASSVRPVSSARQQESKT